jgi:hypothetical protein
MGGIVTPGFKSGFYSPRRGGVPKYPALWNGCIGAWCPSLGQTGLSLIDSSLKRNHGTLTLMDPATDWVASDGKIALDLDGVNDTVVIPAIQISNSGPLTMVAWLNRRSSNASNYHIAFTIGDGTGARTIWIGNHITTGYYGCSHGEGASDLQSTTVGGTGWHCLAITKAGTAFTGYLDGKSIGQYSTANTLATTNITIGNYGVGSFYFDGFIDDYRVYNRALSASELRLLSIRRGIAYELSTKRNFFVAGSPPITGDLSATLASLTLSATGTVAAGASGTVSATLGSLSLVSSGTVAAGASGDTSATLAAVTVSSTGTVAAGASGDTSSTLGAVTLTSSGTVAAGASGDTSATLGAVTLTSSGTVAAGASGDTSVTLASLTLSATGTVAAGATGSLTSTLADVTLSATGAEASTATGSVSATLGAVTLSATGTVTDGATGSVSATLAAVAVSSTGTVAAGASGGVSATLGSLSLASGGSLSAGLTAQVNAALEACVVSSTGTVAAGTTGVLSVQLASVSLVSQGTFVLPGGFRLKVAGTWKDATAFIKVGDWKQATPYIKVNGVWK